MSPSEETELVPSEDRRFPNKMLGVDSSPTFAAHFLVLLEHGVRQTNYVLAFPVSEQL